MLIWGWKLSKGKKCKTQLIERTIDFIWKVQNIFWRSTKIVLINWEENANTLQFQLQHFDIWLEVGLLVWRCGREVFVCLFDWLRQQQQQQQQQRKYNTIDSWRYIILFFKTKLEGNAKIMVHRILYVAHCFVFRNQIK